MKKLIVTILLSISLYITFTGCDGSSDEPNELPTVQITGDELNVTKWTMIRLQADANDTDGSIIAYQWKLGTTLLGTDATLEKRDLPVGTHSITTIVTDDKGATASDEITVNVFPLYRKVQEIIDSDADGIPNRVKRYTYNSFGDLTTYTYINADDNNATDTETYTNDDSGNMLTQNIDFDTDGVVERVDTYTYDEKDNMLSHTYDFNNDGITDRKDAFTYDQSGNTLSENFDYNGDASTDATYTYSYDASGNILTQLSDENGDGIVEGVGAYTYDNYGNLLTEIIDGNVTTTRHWSYTYDSFDNILTQNEDSNDDGTVDSITAYTYDINGTKMLTKYEDFDADSSYDKLNAYTYDQHNNLIEESYDIDPFDELDWIKTTTWLEF